MNLKIGNINIESSTSEKQGVKLSDKINSNEHLLEIIKTLSPDLGFSMSLT